jgi:hypothetical protein
MRFSYDDVGPRYTSVSLVLVQQRIQGVLITPVDPSTPAGTIPARVGARSSAPGGNHSRINRRHRQSDTSRECSKRSKEEGVRLLEDGTKHRSTALIPHGDEENRAGQGSGPRSFLCTYWGGVENSGGSTQIRRRERAARLAHGCLAQILKVRTDRI